MKQLYLYLSSYLARLWESFDLGTETGVVGPTDCCTPGKTVIAWFWYLGSSLEKAVHLCNAQWKEREAKGGEWDAPLPFVVCSSKLRKNLEMEMMRSLEFGMISLCGVCMWYI